MPPLADAPDPAPVARPRPQAGGRRRQQAIALVRAALVAVGLGAVGHVAAAAGAATPATDAVRVDAGRAGKLRLTGGVASIDGAGGGGLTPWAVTGTHATDGQWGASAFASRLRTADLGFTVAGAAIAYGERAELSLAQQTLATGGIGLALGLPGLRLRQDIVGLKLRLAGDAVLDADRWWPQVAAGVQFKRTDAGALAPTLAALGADERGVDVYLSATKVLLAPGLVANLTLRSTRANQNGLLGFGGSAQRGRRWQPEASLAWLPRADVALGVEVRAKPDNLNPSVLGAALAEDDWRDAFVAWAPSKQLSLTLAWVDLGRVAPGLVARRQQGAYLSVQLTH